MPSERFELVVNRGYDWAMSPTRKMIIKQRTLEHLQMPSLCEKHEFLKLHRAKAMKISVKCFLDKSVCNCIGRVRHDYTPRGAV